MTKEEFDELMKNPGVVEMLRKAAAPAAPQKTFTEIRLDEIREAHTEEERERALEWVLRVFKRMIRQKQQVKTVYFVEIESTRRTRKKGLTTAGHKWTEIKSLPAEWLSLFYIDVILDEAHKSDDEKVRAMIAKAAAQKDEEDDPLRHVWKDHHKVWRWIDGEKLQLWTHMIK